MDWLSIVILGLAFTLAILAWIRTVPKRRFLTFLFLVLPLVFFSLRWAAYRMSWTSLWFGALLAMVVIFLWWILLGRRLPSPKDGIQRIWSKDDPFE